MSITFKEKWFWVAGIAKRIKGLEPPPHWRFEVEGDPRQHLLHSFNFVGIATRNNNGPGINPHAREEELIAWIAFYEKVTVHEGGRAEFELLDPTTSCPWE